MKPYDNPSSKKEQVRTMFDRIAGRYDLLNHVLSMSIDRLWRRRTVRLVAARAPRRVLDVATGTGDLALALARALPEARITGLDLSEGMLAAARGKVAARGLSGRIELVQGDAERLAWPDATFDAVTVAFGVRNFGDLERGLSELARVLRPGGQLAVLEFSRPDNPLFRRLYEFYSGRILPRIGGLLSRDKRAYEYLPASVGAFPPPEDFLAMLRAAGLADCTARSQSFGIARIYTARR
ncbi:bifunctional demethylmenaquinone methyltransferase/2-methoxy-6-polyprenyl-1,4-benzoquinol methylase UbiE [uncultured Alistipes sp.]|uniref:bifunctional demethylmenaquinone methyltransferase/2-methoxy-6-polyprenyl-1,4-benzoquinol methylase UbiE n=2 Tax=uncultured Alistipes sp. TaxID=538949 RepID=UPI0025EAC2CE|nr:bifunctional demethylmenaquinone methyltransferase/2-methoxy-6-polyprenyl-1,4-benzoquinol methylase UbiE [uncultured Alistipes sp.]